MRIRSGSGLGFGTQIVRAVGALIVVAGVSLGATVWAQESGDRVEYKKRTVIDLSGATIEGELTKPEGSYIVNRKLSRFSNLITAREDFFNELVTSHNEL